MKRKHLKIKYYPVALNLKRRSAVVAGAGEVAERKIKTLLNSGARVRVIAPEITAQLRHLAKLRKITWVNQPVRASDLGDADIIIAATSDPAVNKKISQWAKRRNALVNIVDQPRLSNFISPALVRAPKVVLAVYTHGKDPVLSRDLKNFLQEHWDVFLSYRDRL